ncbi:hypothetical protein ACFE04_014135 [Oxalis oulophora]
MEDDEEMDIEEPEPVLFYLVEEVDLLYEFDASRFFDFTKPESLSEAFKAENWFQTASSYPPSPFATKLISREGTLLENTAAFMSDGCGMINEVSSTDIVNVKRDCGGVDNADFANIGSKILSGLRFKSQALAHVPIEKPKSSAKPIPRSSTLMKPTASQLAKQTCPAHAATSRFPTLLARSEKVSCNQPLALESQAAKRQKLEGGNLCKIKDAKQHIELLRKVPTKEFHLKTSERALQHSTVSSLSIRCSDSDKEEDIPSLVPVVGNENREQRRPNATGASQLDGNGQTHSFKALPLNKKIFTSKGDISVFRTSKRKTTVPTEFNLPIDLFSKLSIGSDLKPNNGSQMKLPYTITRCMSTEGSKENRLNPAQPGDEVSIFAGNTFVERKDYKCEEAVGQMAASLKMMLLQESGVSGERNCFNMFARDVFF